MSRPHSMCALGCDSDEEDLGTFQDFKFAEKMRFVRFTKADSQEPGPKCLYPWSTTNPSVVFQLEGALEIERRTKWAWLKKTEERDRRLDLWKQEFQREKRKTDHFSYSICPIKWKHPKEWCRFLHDGELYERLLREQEEMDRKFLEEMKKEREEIEKEEQAAKSAKAAREEEYKIWAKEEAEEIRKREEELKKAQDQLDWSVQRSCRRKKR